MTRLQALQLDLVNHKPCSSSDTNLLSYERRDHLLLGSLTLLRTSTTTPPRARLTAEEEESVDRDIELTRRLQNIGIGLSGHPESTRRTIITRHHRREAIRQLSDVLGPDTTTEEEIRPDDEQRNNSTPLSTLTDLPFFGNIETSETGTKNSTESSGFITPSTPTVEEPRPEETEMSGEQSSTPKREQKPKTQEEMIISVATAVLEEKKKDKGVKVAAPEPFDGNRKETRRFLTEVEIYLRMHPTEYDTDEKKCLFFLSYLRGKETQAWKQKNTDLIFDWKDGDEKLEWKDLKAAFKKHYLPIDIKADAQLRIEEMKMGERADDYVNEFRVLADESGYDDEALSHIFRKGLPFVLADKILNQPQGRPKDLNGWYEAAIRFDEQYNRDCPMKNTEKTPEKAVKKTPRDAYVKIQAMFKEYSHEEQKELLNIMEDEGF
uniref:Retrotransposon gag domain-containing protein n=1 Tax=Moniliophthora roreri TaxID=221103 RepID=A0A0W0GCW9_MONRR